MRAISWDNFKVSLYTRTLRRIGKSLRTEDQETVKFLTQQIGNHYLVSSLPGRRASKIGVSQVHWRRSIND